MRDSDQLCAARDLLRDETRGLVSRSVEHARNANLRRRGEQRAEQSEMLDVGGDDLVVGGQAEPGENNVARIRGRADESDVLRSDLKDAGQLLAGAVPQRKNLVEVRLPEAALLEVALVPFRDRLARPGSSPPRPSYVAVRR